MSSNVLRPVQTYGSIDARSQGTPVIITNTSPQTAPTQPARVIAGGVQSAPMATPPPTLPPTQMQSQLYATPMYDSAQGLLGSAPVRRLAAREDYVYVEKPEAPTIQEKFAPFACEFLGTFMLTFTVGCCCMTGTSTWNATAIGFVLMVLIYSVAFVSGGNLNPAVSLTLFCLGKLSLPMMIGYWIVQFAAGILASFLVLGMFFKGVEVGPVQPYGLGSAAFCEIFYTAMLCFVVANCAASVRNNPKADGNQFYALAIGFVIIAGGYASGSISGAMFNPAVALGLDLANLANGMWYGLVYSGFEAIGALIAAVLFKMVRPEDWKNRSAGCVPEDFQPSMASRIFSEFIGTYVLITTVGLNVITKSNVTAWSAGAALMCMVYSLGNVSGGHFNPAVTLAALLSGRSVCKGKDAAIYMVVQLLAGAIAGYVLTIIHKDGNYADQAFGLAPGAGYTWLQTGFAEVAFTFLLAWVVLSVATVSAAYPGSTAPPKKNFYFALAIGACVTIAGFAIGSVSGGSINPAVSLGLSVEMTMQTNSSSAAAAANSSVAAAANSSIANSSLLGLYNATNSTTNASLGPAASAVEAISPKFIHFGYYTLFEFAGGALAALTFHCTHAHEYYSKNHVLNF